MHGPRTDNGYATWNTRHIPEPSAEDVERVAKAIYEVVSQSQYNHDERSQWSAYARAAIAAMREGKV